MMKDLLSPSPRAYFARFLLLGALYLGVVYVSLNLVPAHGAGASLVWPPSAVALAGLYLLGLDLWPALVAAFFALLWLQGLPAPTGAGVALANTAEALAVAYMLRHSDFEPLFNRVRDVFVLIGAAAAGVTLSATAIVGVLYFFGTVPGVFNTTLFAGIWIGHFVSILSMVPFCLRWLAEPRARFERARLAEGMALFGSVAVILALLAWTPYTTVGNIPVVYLLIVPLIWASLRTGSRGITLALVMTALITSTGALFGFGPLAHAPDPLQTLFGVQVLVGTLALIFLLFTATTEERREAVRRLTEHVGTLETSLERVSTEDQAKTDFIAILAHELRNPLSPILSSLELMKHNGIKADNERHVASIVSNVHIMARLLDDLLDISRITQKKFKLQREPVRLESVISQALEIARPYIESRKHALEVDLPQEPVWLNVDPVRLTQVFVNILNNAGKYTEPHGRITLAARARGEEVEICISDTGMGIAPERLSKIFDSFGGADTGARRPGGLHIGLSLTKRMVELHHGSIEPHSAGAGRGSEFVVRLPALAGAPLPLTTPRRRLRSRFNRETLSRFAMGAEPMRVLVVDDNEAAAHSLVELLQKNGRRAEEAHTATDALKQAAALRPDAALLDIGLPDADGYELGRRLRERYGSAIKLIALTGYGQPEDRQKARDAGFDEHIVKPVSIVDLERILSDRARSPDQG